HTLMAADTTVERVAGLPVPIGEQMVATGGRRDAQLDVFHGRAVIERALVADRAFVVRGVDRRILPAGDDAGAALGVAAGAPGVAAIRRRVYRSAVVDGGVDGSVVANDHELRGDATRCALGRQRDHARPGPGSQ